MNDDEILKKYIEVRCATCDWDKKTHERYMIKGEKSAPYVDENGISRRCVEWIPKEFFNDIPFMRVKEAIALADKRARENQKAKFEKMIDELKTKPIRLGFDHEPISDENYDQAYCGGCDRFVIEEGCTCNLVDVDELKQKISELGGKE